MFMLKKFIGEFVFKFVGWKYYVELNVLEDK